MALPKRRHSKTRQLKRRTHDKVTVPAMTQCSNCHATILTHNACGECGYYKGQKVDHTVKAKENA